MVHLLLGVGAAGITFGNFEEVLTDLVCPDFRK